MLHIFLPYVYIGVSIKRKWKKKKKEIKLVAYFLQKQF